jgi:hypothetical protein
MRIPSAPCAAQTGDNDLSVRCFVCL